MLSVCNTHCIAKDSGGVLRSLRLRSCLNFEDGILALFLHDDDDDHGDTFDRLSTKIRRRCVCHLMVDASFSRLVVYPHQGSCVFSSRAWMNVGENTHGPLSLSPRL